MMSVPRLRSIYQLQRFAYHFSTADTWKIIPNFEKYEVSTSGMIRNRKSGRLLTIHTPNILPRVGLVGDDGKSRTLFVNRLVLSTFVPRADTNDCIKLFAAHKDGNPNNNCLSNLEWRTKNDIAREYRKKNPTHCTVPVIMKTYIDGKLIDTKHYISIKECQIAMNKFFGKCVGRCNPNRKSPYFDKSSVSNCNKKCTVNYRDETRNSTIVSNIDSSEKWKKYTIGSGKQEYYVSNFGRVKVRYAGNGREKLRQLFADNKYKSVTLSCDGKAKIFLVHRMVAEMFVGNHNNYTHIDHLDTNGSNNHFSNLRWVKDMNNC